jgi:hypothetical protein
MNYLCLLNTVIVASNPAQGMDVCVLLFCVCLGSGLAIIPRPRSPTVCVWINKLKKLAKVHKGCRTIDRYLVIKITISHSVSALINL